MNKILRAIWFLPFFTLNTAFFGLMSLIASIWSARQARACGPLWAKVNIWATGARLEVEGLDNLPGGEAGVIIASNHNSAADIGAILAGLPLDICWVAKSDLLKIPFLGWHLKRVHIPVSRKKGGNIERLLRDGVEKINNGASIIVFPEGTATAARKNCCRSRKEHLFWATLPAAP
ncbi:MAG: 1-acyl-sn-glycerol-3-phosphate acyltransferase [Deltaproteobacteria bacterium]|nr:1-acyl-sn-glycerol-3-phosphate acyltransferase [Deltaproteobacteria bacterium]